METLYFSWRWEIPDNQVLLTKSWQQVEIIFHWQGDNGKKMAHTKFPIPLIPLPLKHQGLWEIWFTDRMPLPLRQRKNYSEFWTPWKTLPKHRTLLLFYHPRTTNNFAFLFFLSEQELLWFPFLPKGVSMVPWQTDSNCLHFNHKMYSYHLSESMYVLIMFFVEIT